jgi:hypothetical protein
LKLCAIKPFNTRNLTPFSPHVDPSVARMQNFEATNRRWQQFRFSEKALACNADFDLFMPSGRVRARGLILVLDW